MTIYGAIIMPLFIIGPLIFAIVILTTGIDFISAFIALWCVGCSIIAIIYMRQVRIDLQCYSWGMFNEKGIQIKTLFSKKNIEIEYKKCQSIGIGLYVHGVLNSKLGSKEKFIFFSYRAFDEKYRLNINLWKPSATRVKVGFNKELYEYLLTVLPKQQANWLKRDYEKFVKPFSKR